MKRELSGLIFTALILASKTFAQPADTPRMMLWSTLPVYGATTEQCTQQTVGGDEKPSAANVQLLTERSVDGWNSLTGRWQIKARPSGHAEKLDWLRDHCFVLAIDGRVRVRGVALSAHSARLTQAPTLQIFPADANGLTTLRLTSGNYFQPHPLLGVDVLNSVLGTSGRHGESSEFGQRGQ